MISFMLATTLVVAIPSTLTEKQSLRCIATQRRTVEDGLCSKGDRMHLSASIAPGITIGQALETLGRISGQETTKFIVSPVGRYLCAWVTAVPPYSTKSAPIATFMSCATKAMYHSLNAGPKDLKNLSSQQWRLTPSPCSQANLSVFSLVYNY